MLNALVMGSLFFMSQVTTNTPPPKPLSPYVDTTLDVHWDNNSQSMKSADFVNLAKKSGNKSFHLAFLTDAGHCEAAWGGLNDYPLDWLKEISLKAQEAHIELIPSFGGAAGTDLSANCSQNELVALFKKTHALYPSQTLDFDIENGTADTDKLLSALATFQKTAPKTNISLTLPVMPEGLTPTGLAIVKKAHDVRLRFSVNLMAMDYGPSYSGNMGDYAISAATHLFNELKLLYPALKEEALWAKIELTPMIGVNDVNIESFTLNDAKTLRAFAVQKKLNRLSMWSINRDHPCADKWANNHCSGKNHQRVDYQFSHMLNTDVNK